jgi:uncharacterized protein (TIGR03382 family)
MLSVIPLLTLAVASPVLTPTLSFENSNRVRVSHGLLSEPLQGDVREAALAWAQSRAASLGLPPGSTLALGRGYSTLLGGSVHLLQSVQGTAVLNGKVVVTIDAQRRVSLVTSSLVPYTTINSRRAIDVAEAQLRAAKSIPLPALQPNGKPYGGHTVTWFAVGTELHAGYWVYVPTLNPVERWHAAVDATTGEVLRTVNLTLSAKNDAAVYPHSPGGLDAGVGITPTINVSLTFADGGAMTVNNDGGYLVGHTMDSFNCCINVGCNPDAGPHRDAGTTMQGGFPLTYDAPYCERRHLASNVVSKHASGDYVYAPVDPPQAVVSQADPASSDEFAEVHGFFHVNKMHEWVVGLSANANKIDGGLQGQLEPFALRGMTEEMKKLTLWSNVVVPDFSAIDFMCVLQPPCYVPSLTRNDNAYFAPLGSPNGLVLPQYAIDGEGLILFQGTNADFSYDATVVRHEFGHGVIDATAGLQPQFTIDSRSANQEGLALNEGFADFLAAAFGGITIIGPYMGPRFPFLAQAGDIVRDVDNTLSCPSVLWGESHQDSRHVSAALWEARQTHFLGNNNGATFDAAFYAALVAMGPQNDFATAAEVIAVQVGAAFPTVPQAAMKMRAIFDARGVTHCSKVLDVTNAAMPYAHYVIGGTSDLGANNGSAVPGPFQMKLKVPKGTKDLVVNANLLASGFGPSPNVRLLAKFDQPLLFTFASGAIVNDAAKNANAIVSQAGALTASVPLDTACDTERDVYFTLSVTTRFGASLDTLAVSTTHNPACDGVDGGLPGDDGGVGGGTGGAGGMAGSGGGAVGGGGAIDPTMIDPTLGKRVPGCGCQSAPGLLALLSLVALSTRARRRRT